MTERFDVAVVGLGALGSATAWNLARRGISVIGLEQFPLGHERGASHDSSRILRHSYHTPGYVALTHEAYDDWEALEQACGETLVTRTGGVDLFPPDAAIPITDYTSSMATGGVAFDVLDADSTMATWPALRLPEGTTVLHQARTSMVHAARSTATLQRLARRAGAQLVDSTRVTALVPQADGVRVDTQSSSYSCGGVVVCADAWTRDLLLPLGVDLPLTVTEEQVTYFEPPDPSSFAPGRLPVWVWMDDPSFYGFPSYGEATVKAAQDCGGPVVDGDVRSGRDDADMLDLLSDFMRRVLPGSGSPVRSKRCLYTLTPDRDFVLSRVPGIDQVVVGLGAAHGFKFAPTFGRRLADLALGGRVDVALSPYRIDRPALTTPGYATSWLV